MRLLLLLDDWKSTLGNVIRKGANAFKDIIPYGSQINQLLQDIIPEPIIYKTPVRYTVATLVSEYL